VISLLKYWIIFLFASFAVSVLALSFVQTRLIRREGWRVFRARGIRQLYWREISPPLRFAIWIGISAFLLTLLALTVDALLRHI
jgi:hypothetical protein